MKWITDFIQSFGELCYTDGETLYSHSKDYTEDLSFLPQLVVKPENTLQISEILRFCNEHNIVVTPRGAGTGLSGGSLPVFGGVSLSTEKLNKILSIDTQNFQAVVEPGVVNEAFQQALKEMNLFYPPDPASKGSCFLGGNIAHNSGGPKALKYGTTRDYVLNLEVVLPSGEIIWTGSNTLKNSTGYSLTQLMIGSEGTLAVVTKIVFKVLPLPLFSKLLLVSFESIVRACSVVPQIFTTGIQPSALELMERSAVDFVLKYTPELTFPMDGESAAYLLIEVDGNDLVVIDKQIEALYELLERNGAQDVLLAESEAQKEKLWQVRRLIGEKIKSHTIYKEEDAVVQRASIPALLSGVKEIGAKFGFESVCYGHAGDGNIHINILKGDLSDEFWNGRELEEAIRQIFRVCKKLGGTISGEHGIGYVQKKYINEVLSPIHISLLKGIKSVFDPNGILNPGKIWE